MTLTKLPTFSASENKTNAITPKNAKLNNPTPKERPGMLDALLKAKDPGFGGLVRVMIKRQEFLWDYEKFAGEY
jgi:hypothetical protein